MPDSIEEIVKPSAEAITLSIHPDLSPHIEEEGDIKHLANIQANLSEHRVETTGPLVQVSPDATKIDASQFDVPSQTAMGTSVANQVGGYDDTSSWGKVKKRREAERKVLKRAA